MTLRNKLLVALGFVLLLLGAIGLFLPIWPTTPFVIGAAGCFSGSAKLSGWLRRSRFFGEYIVNYKERTGLTKRTVRVSLIFLWTMLCLSVAWTRTLWSAVLLSVVGLAVTVHILYIARPRTGPA